MVAMTSRVELNGYKLYRLSWICDSSMPGKSDPQNILPNGGLMVMNPMLPSNKITLNKSKLQLLQSDLLIPQMEVT